MGAIVHHSGPANWLNSGSTGPSGECLLWRAHSLFCSELILHSLASALARFRCHGSEPGPGPGRRAETNEERNVCPGCVPLAAVGGVFFDCVIYGRARGGARQARDQESSRARVFARSIYFKLRGARATCSPGDANPPEVGPGKRERDSLRLRRPYLILSHSLNLCSASLLSSKLARLPTRLLAC